MAKYFLFLEILDPDINALLLAIDEIVSGKRPTRSAHLTVRGPYDAPVPKKTLDACRTEMKYDVLRIANVGRFSNPTEEVVYFQVDSPHLRNIWYKPEFQIGQYGFNPHLSLYRGKDKHWADIIANFLDGERIELLCAEFQLVPYISKQMQLIPQEVKISPHFSRLIDSGRIHETFMSRLTNLANQYKTSTKHDSKAIQRLLL